MRSRRPPPLRLGRRFPRKPPLSRLRVLRLVETLLLPEHQLLLRHAGLPRLLLPRLLLPRLLLPRLLLPRLLLPEHQLLLRHAGLPRLPLPRLPLPRLPLPRLHPRMGKWNQLPLGLSRSLRRRGIP